MAALSTVQDYVTAARVLLQDTVAPYRYSDAELTAGLNFAILDARRIRPDLFLSLSALESFSTVNTTTVTIDEQYRVAFLYYIVGHAQLRDDEAEQDARAGAFLTRFSKILTAGA